jgi:protein TonB
MRLLRTLLVFAMAAGMTLAVFLVLPVLQAVANPERDAWLLRTVEIGNLPPPPPSPPEEILEEEEPPEPPPPLTEEAAPLELSQLEVALNPGLGDSAFGDFSVQLVAQATEESSESAVDEIFSLAQLDRQPRVIIQTMPTYPPELRRKKRTGTVHVLFLVDQRGRVTNARVQKSTDPAFEEAALRAVRQWRFEPGTRGGKPVQFKMLAPITFNAP